MYWHSHTVTTPIECSAIGCLLTLSLTETHTEMCTQRVDLILENNTHYIQNSTSPISFKFHNQVNIYLSTCLAQLVRIKNSQFGSNNYRLITAYLLLWVNLDKIMHARWDFDASSARTRRVSALDKHQNWSASALFCLISREQSKHAVVNLIHTRRKQTFLSFIMWWIRHFSKFESHLNITNKI